MNRTWLVPLGLCISAGCAPGPWDGPFEVEDYTDLSDGCAAEAVSASPGGPYVAIAFGSDPFGGDRVQVHWCDRDQSCADVPRWTATLDRVTETRIAASSAEVLAIEAASGASCTLAWNTIDIRRSGRDLSIDVEAWSVVDLGVNSMAECDGQLEILQDEAAPCDAAWRLAARAEE
ncbi:MAG: hypothetical protein ACI8PZ_005690 [Myxococcota bacterium]|jgi:hypothetical protein